MKAPTMIAAAAVMAAGLAPSGAAQQLLDLVPPTAKVLAGVNVEHAKTSTLGQYIVLQMQQGSGLQDLIAQTGFNPTLDVSQVLAASAGPGSKAGLVLASGTFNEQKIAAVATAKGAATETYNGVTILEDPKQTHGVGFLAHNTIAAAGDLASVKTAIDRQIALGGALPPPAPLPSSLVALVGHWSVYDAWVVSTIPPSALHTPQGAPAIPGVGQSGPNNAFQNLQGAAGGVMLDDTTATFYAQAQADNSQDATGIANALQLLVSMAQLQTQSNNNPQVQAILQSLKVTTDGAAVNISFSLPETDLQALLQHHPHARPRRTPVR